MSEVEIRTFKEVDLRGGTVVAAFPSVGLVSTIATTYLIMRMPVDQVCALESADLPALSMIYAKKPKFPARVYAHAPSKLAMFICEVPLPHRAMRPIAHALLRWSQSQHVRQIVALEGLPADDVLRDTAPGVWGVGSTDRARAELDRRRIKQLDTGMIAGVSGVLLNEGRWQDFDVIALLAEARPNQPDAKAAVAITQALDDLLPELEVDLAPLQEQARVLEEHLRRLKTQAQPAVAPEVETGSMYR
ncbi:MAG: proteasome assembly chaperone family protein [Methanobacteriota archaeon]